MNITVYAASSGQVPADYVEVARRLGAEIAQRGHVLYNGAGRLGLMAATTEGCLAAGGKAVGVIPEFMIEQSWQHTGMSELIITRDMHERKERLAQESQACIALPGGCGTMEELLEIITWKQLGLYLNPIVILNIGGFYDALLSQLEKASAEHFMRPLHLNLWRVALSAEEAVKMCEETPLWDASLRKYAAL
ncbi:MAG: TIGR00730 family Rossman fold protein [Alloprevotella sp.]|nr:TIGR00730 family Rossman fold protein [Alloprevotella sp.]